MYEEDLKKILTEGETKVYLALLETGTSTVGPIVKKSGVAYSNVYDVLRRLMEKGVVSYIVKSKTKYFQPASPKNLVDYLEKKEKEVSKQKNAMKKITPELEKLQSLRPQQDAEVFIGKKGLKTAYIKLLSDCTSNDEHLFLYTYEEEYYKESDLFYFSIQDILKDVKIKGISNKEYAKSTYLKQAKYIATKFVETPLPGNIDIFKDKVLIVNWKKPTTSILIQSQEIADSMRKYFYTVWN